MLQDVVKAIKGGKVNPFESLSKVDDLSKVTVDMLKNPAILLDCGHSKTRH